MLSILENVPLAPYTTFNLGGPARFFIAATTVAMLRQALSWARERQLPVFILAGGSNLIVADHGFSGLVILIQLDSWRIAGRQLISEAATPMATLVDASIEAGLAGLEWAGGLPGTFGGAIRGNAGAFGGEIKDSVLSVQSVVIATGEERTRTNADCQFVYRGSIFKTVGEVITTATLTLQPGEPERLRQTANSHIEYRRQKHPLEFPNAGSIFKNTPIEQIPNRYLQRFASAIKTDPFPVVPTAKIIDEAGLRGLRVGDAEVSAKHTNYIVNRGQATARDLITLIEKIKATVKEQFQIDLELEPELVGF